MWRHFVYIHKRADDGSVFYVGKGTRDKRTTKRVFARAYDTYGRNRWWLAVVNKHGFDVEILAMFKEDAHAQDYERFLIAAHGRERLVNLTDGGEGMAGHVQSRETIEKRAKKMVGRIPSAETRAKISLSLRGERHPLFGKRRSDETRRRQSQGSKDSQRGGKSTSAKAVLDTATGTIFPSTRDAAEHFGIRMRYLSAQLAGERTNKTTMVRP